MTNDWATWSLLGMSPLALALRLREAFSAGAPAWEVLEEAQRYGLHPLSIAVAKPTLEAGRDRKYHRAWKAWDRAANRRVGARLGLGPEWLSVIQGNGLDFRDPRVEQLPEGLAAPVLSLKRLCKLKELPSQLAATWLHVEQCHGLSRIPATQGLLILDVFDCRSLEELPSGLELDTLRLSACPNLRRVPPINAGSLNLRNCPVETLPEDMGLSAFSLRNLPLLQEIPNDMVSVLQRARRVENCPRLLTRVEQIKKIVRPLPQPSLTTMGHALQRAGLAGGP